MVVQHLLSRLLCPGVKVHQTWNRHGFITGVATSLDAVRMKMSRRIKSHEAPFVCGYLLNQFRLDRTLAW